jgi:hypothetical protein
MGAGGRNLRPNLSSWSGGPAGLGSDLPSLLGFGWARRVSVAPFETKKPLSSEAISPLVV